MEGEVLRDDQWERIKPFVPGGRKGKRGPRSDGRLFIDALLWMARSGGRWRDLPERFGPFERAKKNTVAIEVNNIVALSTKTYQVDWTEFERDRKGKETGTRRFRGIATVALTAPQDEAIIRLNPIGLYVTDFDWTAQL